MIQVCGVEQELVIRVRLHSRVIILLGNRIPGSPFCQVGFDGNGGIDFLGNQVEEQNFIARDFHTVIVEIVQDDAVVRIFPEGSRLGQRLEVFCFNGQFNIIRSLVILDVSR